MGILDRFRPDPAEKTEPIRRPHFDRQRFQRQESQEASCTCTDVSTLASNRSLEEEKATSPSSPKEEKEYCPPKEEHNPEERIPDSHSAPDSSFSGEEGTGIPPIRDEQVKKEEGTKREEKTFVLSEEKTSSDLPLGDEPEEPPEKSEQKVPELSRVDPDKLIVEPVPRPVPVSREESILRELSHRMRPVEQKEGSGRLPWKSALGWLKNLCLLLVVAYLFSSFVLQRNLVLGDAMAPQLMNKDQIIVRMKPFLLGGPKRGDIITMKANSLGERVQAGDLVKRIVAVGGDEVQLKDGAVYVNGQKLEEYYLPEGTRTEAIDLRFERVTLGPNQYYVLGDNREESLDSRFFGPIVDQDIAGIYWFRIYPFSR